MTQELWEILVPTKHPNGNVIPVDYHRVWDAKVREISHGMTIAPPAKGEWVNPEGTLFAEEMIPVRFLGTKEQALEIAKFTLNYYDQEAVMHYKISNEVSLIYKEEHGL